MNQKHKFISKNEKTGFWKISNSKTGKSIKNFENWWEAINFLRSLKYVLSYEIKDKTGWKIHPLIDRDFNKTDSFETLNLSTLEYNQTQKNFSFTNNKKIKSNETNETKNLNSSKTNVFVVNKSNSDIKKIRKTPSSNVFVVKSDIKKTKNKSFSNIFNNKKIDNIKQSQINDHNDSVNIDTSNSSKKIKKSRTKKRTMKNIFSFKSLIIWLFILGLSTGFMILMYRFFW